MKKIIFTFSFLFLGLFSFNSNVFALTTTEENIVNLFYSTEYDSDFPYCVFENRTGFQRFVCLKSEQISKAYLKTTLSSNFNYRFVYYDMSDNVLFSNITYKNSNYVFETRKTYSFTSLENYFAVYDLSLLHSNFDFFFENYDGDKNLFVSDFQFKTQKDLIFNLPENYFVILRDSNNNEIDQNDTNSYHIVLGNYTYSIYHNDTLVIENEPIVFNTDTVLSPIKKVVFNIPENSTFILKDIKGNVINSESNTYYLPFGNYSYSLSKPGFFSKENEQINITEDITLTLDLNSKYNPNSMQSIFTQYYNYIRDLISDIFPLENPLFLFLITFIIGFSIITIIRKLIGGIF